jgi:hypothetical protein
MKCYYCNKPLKIIGYERKNGIGDYKDWENRGFHKKCYKMIKEFKDNDIITKEILKLDYSYCYCQFCLRIKTPKNNCPIGKDSIDLI